jgi:sulfur relay (sulfurtransferase) DsrC/TusE family protein
VDTRAGWESKEADSLTKSDDAARGAAHFKVVHQPDGRFHWKLINPHGTPVVRSMETFATEDEAVANAEYAQRLISGAPIRRP